MKLFNFTALMIAVFAATMCVASAQDPGVRIQLPELDVRIKGHPRIIEQQETPAPAPQAAAPVQYQLQPRISYVPVPVAPQPVYRLQYIYQPSYWQQRRMARIMRHSITPVFVAQ